MIPDDNTRKNKNSNVIYVWLFVILGMMLVACTQPTLGPTPTPTRTSKPTLTPTPSPTLTPSPTPTPAFPITISCAETLPLEVCDRLHTYVTQDPAHFSWTADTVNVNALLGSDNLPQATALGNWTYAVVAPFFTVTDEVTGQDLRAIWAGGSPSGIPATSTLLVTTDTLRVFTYLWGVPSGELIQTVALTEMLSLAEQTGAWGIVPFHHLEPQWKVLRVDGISLLEKGISVDTYPLNIPLYYSSAARPETLALLPDTAVAFTNRYEPHITLIAMTGVTAITRGTAQLMERAGITYPAKDIKAWFADADFVHVSNEVSFRPDCVAEGSGTMSFCSHDSYIALLEEINTNIVELTGNHLEDKGTEWVAHSLDMYRERGWQWFGGGTNQQEGAKPLTLTHNMNNIAFIGCNAIGPFADEDSGGAARCDYEQMRADIHDLRAAGYLPIVTIQYLETYEYFPTPQQIRDFRYLAEAGAVMVQGSQAHQAQTLEFYGETFIHYGLGNFFFDQMWSDGTRQEFVDRLLFYNGRLLSIELRTAILEEYGRPRPMTIGDPNPAADRQQFLQMIFDLRP
ncbi:MAG: CapA family protein [Anaerolineae bacterium]|nr:CapA family protein [Anaerolineae bacterium]